MASTHSHGLYTLSRPLHTLTVSIGTLTSHDPYWHAMSLACTVIAYFLHSLGLYCHSQGLFMHFNGLFINPQVTIGNFATSIHCKDKMQHIFPDKELRGHSPNSYIHVSVCDLYIPTIGLHVLLQENWWTDRGITHRDT
jgi:hypothetical protein